MIEKDGFFDIFYVLSDPGDYDLDIKFGGKKIPDGSFTVKVYKTISTIYILVSEEFKLISFHSLLLSLSVLRIRSSDVSFFV